VKRILLVVLVVAAGAALLLVPRPRAQVQLTLEPSMTKGPASAPVTIVEFSDYQ
jgi:hypothetical protein